VGKMEDPRYRLIQPESLLNHPHIHLGNMTLINGMSEGLKYVLLAGLRNSVEASVRIVNPYIEILIDGNRITIKNRGAMLFNYRTTSYIPEIVFGIFDYYQMHDGIGIRSTNIFSTLFHVTIGNSVERRQYEQLWQNNGRLKSNPIITEYHGDDFVKISFELDFERFGCTGLTQEMIDVLGAYCKTIDKSITVLGYFAEEPIKEPEYN
jgi:hypothetical protein